MAGFRSHVQEQVQDICCGEGMCGRCWFHFPATISSSQLVSAHLLLSLSAAYSIRGSLVAMCREYNAPYCLTIMAIISEPRSVSSKSNGDSSSALSVTSLPPKNNSGLIATSYSFLILSDPNLLNLLSRDTQSQSRTKVWVRYCWPSACQVLCGLASLNECIYSPLSTYHSREAISIVGKGRVLKTQALFSF